MFRDRVSLHGIIILSVLYLCEAGWTRGYTPSYQSSRRRNTYTDYHQAPGYHSGGSSPRYSSYSSSQSKGYSNYGSQVGTGYNKQNYYGNTYNTRSSRYRSHPPTYGYSQPKSNSYVDGYQRNRYRHSPPVTPIRSYSRVSQSYSPHGSRPPRLNQQVSSYSAPSYPKPSNNRPARSRPNYRAPTHQQPHYSGPNYQSHHPPKHSYRRPSVHRPVNHPKPSFSKPRYSAPRRHIQHKPNRPPYRRRTSRRRRPARVRLPKPPTRNGFYQMHYRPRRQNNDFYQLKYPKVPTYDFSYSQDTSGYNKQRKQKVACYQCNYRPGKPHWEIVKVKKSVPDPYNPFRYMSVDTDEYVKKDHVAGGWDKCQGNITPRSAKVNGIYSEASCDGNCYIRTEKNGMVYRGCYAGEWAVNQHMYGCSYQAGSLYCFCRGSRCNGFLAPASFSEPFPHSYGNRRNVPFPSDYADNSRYNPYPSLSTHHQRHPPRRRQSYHSRPHRYKRSISNVTEENVLEDENETAMIALMMTADRPDDEGRSVPSGKTDPYKTMRKCYQCSSHPGSPAAACKGPFTKAEAEPLGLTSDDCFGNCYVQITSNSELIRGCYSGEVGINQHLIGCHLQNNSTYCFCRGHSCNRFAVTIEETDLSLLEAEVEAEEEAEEEENADEVEEQGDSEDAAMETEDQEETAVTDVTADISSTETDHEEDLEEEGDEEDFPIILYYVQFPELE